MTDPLMSQRANGGIGGFLSAGMTWPRRGRPNSLNFRPLRSTNPGQSPEASMDSPQPSFLSSQSQQKSGYVSPLKAASRTMKEYDQEIDSLRSENFKLKLSLYFLENDMEKRMNNPEEKDILKMNLQLKVDTEIIKRELAQKNTALHEIMIAMERQEEQHKLELQRAREIQVDLENQVEALKQELEKEKIVQTPRSSDIGSEIYKQAFGMDESLSGMSSSDHEVSLEQIRSQYVSELDKVHCTIDEKDKEIKNMKIVIEDLEKNNKSLEEKVRKRNLAIQGFLQMAKKQDSIHNLSQSQGNLHQHLAEAIETANAGNRDSVVSNMNIIRKGLQTILSATGNEVSLDLCDDTEHLKREIARKDDIIKGLEDRLFDQTRFSPHQQTAAENMKNLPSCSNYSVERECERLQKAVREKDNLIQELLEERTKMSTEHGKTVKNLVTQLKSLSEGHSRIVDLSVFDPESVKLLQEQICEKDVEINKHKKTADTLNSELTKCQTELQNSLVENESKTRKILQLTNRGLELDNELAEIRHNMHMLKREYEQCKMLSAKDLGSDQVTGVKEQGKRSSSVQEILINLEDSLQSPTVLSESDNSSLIKVRGLWESQEGNIPLGVESSNNIDVHDQHSSFQGTRLVDNLTLNLPDISDPSLQPMSSNTKEISEYVSLKTSTNETVRLCINMQIKDRKKPKEAVDCVEHSAEQSEQEKLLQILEDKNEEIVKLERTLTVQQDLANVLAEDKKHLQDELGVKVSDVQFLTVACRDFERQVHSLQSQHCTDMKRVEELEQALHHVMDRPKIPVLKSCAAVQTDKIPTKDSECNTVFFGLESGTTSFGQSDCVNILQADICMLILMIEEKDKEIQQYKELNDKLTSELEIMMVQSIQSNNRSQHFSSYSEDSSVALQQLNTSQDLNAMLFQHLKQVAKFMESLLPGRGTKILDASSLTPESVSNVMKHICDSIELSQSLSHSLSFWEESRIFNPEGSSRLINESSVYAHSENGKLDRDTLETNEGFGSTSRRIQSEGSFRRDVIEPKLDILVESRLLTLERSIEDKLTLVQKLTQTVQANISGLTEVADKSCNGTHSLMNINVEISNLQSTLANAVEEVKILKDTTKESAQVSHECNLSEQLKLYNEEILSKIDDIEQMKEILVKERYARESAEQNLYLCHQELLTVKQQLSGTMLKLEEKCKLEQEEKLILRRSAEELRQKNHHIPEKPVEADSQRDVDHLRKNLAEEEERNKFLSKQINDILNENRKLKVESEQLQLHLMEEQRNLEEVRQQLIFEQDVVKQLSKGKHASESKTADLAASLIRMRSSLTDLQDQNRNLNKRVSSLLSENNKMKVEVEESQTQLNSEHEQNEKLSKEHFLKQQSLSQLAKEKLAAENKTAYLVAEIETLKNKLAEQEDQNSSLNKQISDLSNDNWKVKKELEQLEARLRNEVEHMEAARKAKSDLHKTNMDLVTEKGDLENRLHYSEDKVRVLAEEKTDLSKQMFEGQRENKDLIDQIKILSDQKALLEKEINKYKTEIHSSDSVCDEARYDLKQTKEKLKRLELKCRQYENEMTRLTTSNEHLMSEKSALEMELESQASKALELSKQHGETKRLLKERTKSYIEIEREKSLLLDQTENFKSKKVQAEMSRDKLLADYDSLIAKVNNLDLSLKDSELSLQKNKDEQEHLKQQTNSLLNKIKQKESVIKDLEEQQEILHEQLKDLQHNLNKSDIDLKHVEDENHSLELRLLSLQKQLNRTSSHLEMKDDEIMSLQEQILKLEQKIKDKEMTRKRTLTEKQISEEKVQELQHHIKKKESAHKLMTKQEQELREQIAHLAEELHNKEIEGKRSKEEMTSLQADIEGKEKALRKLESSLKKLEHKLSVTEDTNAQLTCRLNQTEVARKLSEEQTESFLKELNELKERMKTQREEHASASRLSIALGQLNDKEEYCKALENKVIEYRKELENLQQEYNRLATAPTSQFSEIHARSMERMHPVIVPNKVFSEPRSSQEYRLHRESKLKGEQDNFIKCLELDNSDLKMQIEILKKKFDIAEKVNNELEEENHSLWKTLYGSEHDRNHIIQTLESKNSELKKQVEELENKIELFEKSQIELEEEKNTLWQTLYGKEGEETDMAKRFEQKNKELKDQLEAFQLELREAEESKENLREERDTLWKTIHGKKDEKTDVIRELQLKNNDLKGQMGDLQRKLDASEKAKSELEEEKNSLWKALYGQHGEKSDVTKMLEMKNKELMVTIEVLEKKLDHCEKAKADVEEKKDTLWKTLHGSQDEKTEAMKKMEEKNNELKAQITIFQKKLSDADEMTAQLEEEKNSMWKTLCGSEDEKTDLLQQMEMRNVDLKSQIEILKRDITSLEKANHEMEEEKNSLWKTLYGSEHEQADIIRRLEVKNNGLKGEVHVLEKKLESSEKTKQDLEDRINSLRVTLHGDENEKADAFRSMELKNSDLLAQIELLKINLSDMEKDKNEIEEEKASLWRTLCGNEGEKTDVMKLVEQKNNDLKVQVEDLENQLKAAEKAHKEMEDEKNSLWKTLYGSEHEQSDLIKRLEKKNNDLNEQAAALEKKLNASEEAKHHLEEEKASLWKALHGSDDKKTHEIKSLEMKNSGFKGQLEVLTRKLSATEKLKNDFEEEKNSLWKNMYGSQDEKAAALTKLNLEISDLKSVFQNLESKFIASEKVNNDLKEENVSLNEKLHESAEENANINHKLELKDHDMKSQMEVLEEKLKVSEDLKKAIEEERNSLYNQLLGDPSGAKLEGMLKETQIYADQVKKLENELCNKSTLLLEMKEQLFKSESSLATQEKVVECLNKEISNYKMQLQRALTEREWFQNQYIDSQRQVIRAVHSATAESEIRPEDVVIVQKENVDLKKEVTDLLSVIQGKDTAINLPPVHTELLTIKVPEFLEQKPESSSEHRLSSEMQRAELERLQIEKHYLQNVLNDLKKQMESQPPRVSEAEHQPEKIAIPKESSGFSLSVAEQLAHRELPNEEVEEEMKQLRNERDYFRNLANNLQNEMQLYTASLRDKGPSTYAEAENAKLRKENADLKNKLVEMHARVKKRESMIKALSSKIVELSEALKDSRVASGKDLTEHEKATDHMSLLASQIVEHGSKAAEKSLSEVIMIPEVSTFDFKDEEDTNLLSLLHPTLQYSVPAGSEVQDIDAESMQSLKYQVKELEHQLADTLMDNYRLQDEINTMMLKFGIQNNKVVCEKCGKSAEITSAKLSTDIKAISKKFTSYFKHLDRDPVFSKEDRINKLSENKWKLQNEVLNMQRTLCLSNPAYFEHQESFNNHIAKMVATEYPKIPVRIFSEPLLVSEESKDVVQKTRHLELLWKNQVLHLERDIKCLQNYRTFLEHFVLGLVKELTVPTKQKAEVSASTSSIEEQSQTQETRVPAIFLKRPQHMQDAAVAVVSESTIKPSSTHMIPPEDGSVPQKFITSQEAQLFSGLPASKTVPTEVSEDLSSSQYMTVSGITRQTSSVPGSVGTSVESLADIPNLQNRISELNKTIEKLKSENMTLQTENKTLSLQIEKISKIKSWNERQFEKQVEDLKESLKNLKSLNATLDLELDFHRRLLQPDKPSEKQAGYVKKSDVMKYLHEMNTMNCKLERLTEENIMLRKKLMKLPSPASKAAKFKDTSGDEESSSEKGSEETTARSSMSSSESFESYPGKYGSASKQYQDPSEFHGISTTQRKGRHEPSEKSVHRPHFSSPDLGIESDPNYEQRLLEPTQDEKFCMETHPSKQPVTPSRTRQGRPATETVAAMWESVKAGITVGESLLAMGDLKDYTLLRKEIDESVVLIKSMCTTAKHCVEHLGNSSSANKNLAYSTLREILNKLISVKVCQDKAQQIVSSFWVSTVPASEEFYVEQMTVLLNENQELRRKLEIFLERREQQKAELKEAFGRLKVAEACKEKMERAIAKQLSRTNKVLKHVKTNTKGPDAQDPASHRSSNPSSKNKSSTK